MTTTLTGVAEPIQTRMRLEQLGQQYADHRAAGDALRDRLADTVRQAIAEGMTEVEAARLAGVSRMTVRAWLGKGATSTRDA